ncbi:MAG: sulfatase [Sedimentisphaerales bacterium]|nr:sulfatase [Sedimentisphaerales bacterium]
MHPKYLSRRDFIRWTTAGTLLSLWSPIGQAGSATASPNILLITVDDMNCSSVGVYDSPVPDATPHINRLASEGLRFAHAHVTVAVCQPCRGALATGRYPHCSGIIGFNHITNPQIKTIHGILQEKGFLTGILGKVSHMTPHQNFRWDMWHNMEELGWGRDPQRYYTTALSFFQRAHRENRPFYFCANSHDPHRPFSGSDQEKQAMKRWGAGHITSPSRAYQPEEIDIPDFLPDLPEIRREIAEYYSSVRRADDTAGAILRALHESGMADNTLVMLLSDNGMALPFAKTNCYFHSTHTPWIVRWPGKIRPGTCDQQHFISSIDFLPTVLEAVGVSIPEGIDGTSFLPLLRGQTQPGRDCVFTQFHETSARSRYPMRCIQTRRYGYIFSPWSDGKRVFRNESQSGRSFHAMVQAAERNSEIASRVHLFQYRVPEELYDFTADPDALYNLIDDPTYEKTLSQLRDQLLVWMRQTGDPALTAFENRTSTTALSSFMQEQEEEAKQSRSARQKN